MKENRKVRGNDSAGRATAVKPGKRPIRALSVMEKVEAIQRVHDGESKASVARDIGVPESTLRGWCKSEQKIRSLVRNSCSTPENEVISPALTPGSNAFNSQNLSQLSEDEIPARKKMRVDHKVSSALSMKKENGERSIEVSLNTNGLNYFKLLNMSGFSRSESNALLYHQLELMNTLGAQNLISSIKPSVTSASASTIGLMENDLQSMRSRISLDTSSNHSKNRNNNNNNDNNDNINIRSSNNKNHSPNSPTTTQSSMIFPIPPVSQAAPITLSTPAMLSNSRTITTPPIPATPPKTPSPIIPIPPRTRNSSRQNTSSWSQDMFLTRLERLVRMMYQPNQASSDNTHSTDEEINNPPSRNFFWEFFKNIGFLDSSFLSNMLENGHVMNDNRSDSTKTTLDKILLSNNNNEVKNLPKDAKEALEHGEKLYEWLEKSSTPNVTKLQIVQLRHLIDKIKKGTESRKSPEFKHRRK